jgi:hypothetical protein
MAQPHINPGPGGGALMRILRELSLCTTKDAVKELVESFSFVLHYHYDHLWDYDDFPTQSATLRNGFSYDIPSQECEDLYCRKTGFTIRDWRWWKIHNGWHPPLSLERYTSVRPAYCDVAGLGDDDF